MFLTSLDRAKAFTSYFLVLCEDRKFLSSLGLQAAMGNKPYNIFKFNWSCLIQQAMR